MQTDGRDRSGKTPQEDDGGEKWQEKKKTTSLTVKRRMKKLPKINFLNSVYLNWTYVAHRVSWQFSQNAVS